VATRLKAALERLVAGLLLGLIRVYQLALSPWLGGHCRHEPTCSVYAATAIRRFGPARGAWLTLKRLARCQPWGTAGYDPVPECPQEGIQG
jgi:putative membrane protein insertion efficiency factor